MTNKDGEIYHQQSVDYAFNTIRERLVERGMNAQQNMILLMVRNWLIFNRKIVTW